jgi:hypothetical protein
MMFAMNIIAFFVGLAALLAFFCEAMAWGVARLRLLPVGLLLAVAAWMIQASVVTTHTVVFHW